LPPNRETRYDVGLVTSALFPDLPDGDRLLLDALARRDLRATPVIWDDPGVNWQDIRVSVIRATWDYHLQRTEFLAWAERAAALTNLWNPLAVLRWNSHKSYLRDLAARGVPVVPTLHLEAGSAFDLASAMSAAGWNQAVIKPAVSLNSYETVVVPAGKIGDGQAHIDRLLPALDLMVQPYLRSVSDYGERSLIFILHDLTHAVRRPPALENREGAFWQQAIPVSPASEEIALAKSALDAVGARCLYARADIVRDDAGAPLLMELELVEPSLFFELAPQAVERCADAIAAICAGG